MEVAEEACVLRVQRDKYEEVSKCFRCLSARSGVEEALEKDGEVLAAGQHDHDEPQAEF